MRMKNWSSLIFSFAILSSLAGCGGGNTAIVRNAPDPASSSPSIAFQPAPPGSLFINSTASLTAVVSNDSGNAGVDWALTCKNSGNCGSLSPLHTSSGASTTYRPPVALSQNSEVVNIVAFATSDHTSNVVASITVTGFAGGLKGRYVLQTKGVDSSGPYQFASVADFDGNGGITSGEQTYSNSLMSVADPVTGGSYFIGPDGRGTMTLKTTDQNLGQQGLETFSLVLLSSSQGLIAKVDDTSIKTSSSETSTGTLDLQTSTAAPNRGYAFVVSGSDPTVSALAIGGVLNIDSPNTISGVGSVADLDLAGTLTLSAPVTGTVSDTDSFGAVEFTLNAPFATIPIQLTGYIVDALHVKLIETDNQTGTGFGSTGGIAIGQGTATGTFGSNSAFAGTQVFGLFGYLGGVGAATPASTLASVGVFTADGAGNLTNGFNDEFATSVFIEISDSFTGTYTVDATGTGRVDTGSSITFTTGPGPELIFYLTGNGNPSLVLDADAVIGAVGAGTAYPAASQLTFDGEYGLSFTQSVNGGENDSTGQITANSAAQTFSGVVDSNFGFSSLPNTTFTGSFAATSMVNRFTGQVSTVLLSSPSGPLSVAYYLIDSGHAFFIETDSVGLTYGYLAARTPVCPSCPSASHRSSVEKLPVNISFVGR